MHIQKITAADIDTWRFGLIELLLDAVGNGASVGFVAGITIDEAQRYWDEVKLGLAAGSRLMWIVEHAGRAIATVQLDLCQRKNGVNRAEVQKLLVHADARRTGIATALMHTVEGEALRRERGLVYLDTEAGSPAESFYHALGYTYAGGLPEYACSPDGTWGANAIYYKTLFVREREYA